MLARRLIGVGGVSVIVFIALIFFYLAYVVLPLFKSAEANLVAQYPEPGVNGTTVYLADTFEGVVKATEEDIVYRGGEHSDTSEKIVQDLLQETNASNAIILKGIFPDDHPDLQLDKVKLCHIDVDTYLSAKDVFDFVWPKIPVGGIVVFDDYGFWTCEGVTRYFNSLDVPGARKIHNLNGHGLIIKYKN